MSKEVGSVKPTGPVGDPTDLGRDGSPDESEKTRDRVGLRARKVYLEGYGGGTGRGGSLRAGGYRRESVSGES